MNKYIVLSFVFMGFAFYELSGGDEFVARKADLMAAAEAEATRKAEARAARLASVRPASNSAETAKAVPTEAEQPTSQPEQETAEHTPVAPLENTGPVTLASLQENTELFARPVIQLGTLSTSASEPAQVPEREPEPLDIRQVAGSRVNMRMGPGTGYDIVTSLSQGTAVEVIDTDGSGWVKLRTLDGDQTGWMAEYLLTSSTG